MRILHGLGAPGLAIIVRMMRSWDKLGLVGGAFAGLLGCSQAADPSPEDSGATLSELSAVEVTTVTTVQASTGVFLSPRPQQMRPAYVEQGRDGAAAVDAPSVDLDRAKVDSALLFSSKKRIAAGLPLLATFSSLSAEDEPLPQHFFPALEADGPRAAWPLELRAGASQDATDLWTEWDGWRAFAGFSIGAAGSDESAPAATLDYEVLGLQSPLVLTSEGEDIIITNRSEQAIAKVLLVYSHPDGVGVREVLDLGPGMQRVTTTGPKEHNAEVLLQRARAQLAAFFSENMGPELGPAVAQSKSIPFLETQGLRLIYMLDEAQAPAALALPAGLSEQRRFVVAQAEVLAPAEEEHVLGLLDTAELTAGELPNQLGRFTRAKLEVARLLGNPHVQQQSADLLQTLSE